MKRLEKVALISALIEKLYGKGSWCGETHIQKTMYFLQELLKVPMEFNFILYKHGPFSFDLRDELTAMRADGIVELRTKFPEYGPSLVITERGKRLRELYRDIVSQYNNQLSFIVENIGDKGVVDLERLATALYVTLEQLSVDNKTRAKRINFLKPHISEIEAKFAVESLDSIIQRANLSN